MKTETQPTKENLEAAQTKAKEKLENLKTQLAAINEKISSQREAPSVDESNAKKILNGVDAADLSQQPAGLKVQKRALEKALSLQTHEIHKLEAQKRIRLKLLRSWGEFGEGSRILFGESKGRSLIESGVAVEIPAFDRAGKYLPNEPKKKNPNAKIRLKLLKRWADFGAGSVIDFGESKGRRLIDNGTAVEVSKKQKLNKITARKTGVVVGIKLIKDWGGRKIGDILSVAEPKASGLINDEIAIAVLAETEKEVANV